MYINSSNVIKKCTCPSYAERDTYNNFKNILFFLNIMYILQFVFYKTVSGKFNCGLKPAALCEFTAQ